MSGLERLASLVPAILLLSALEGCSAPGGKTPAPPVDLSDAEVVVMVRFKSEFDADEVRRRYPARMPEFRSLPGLVQKFYLYDEQACEWAGIYLWDSMEAVEAYLESDLRKSIPSAYGVIGNPRVESYRLVDKLR